MANVKSFFKSIKKASRGHRISSVGIEFGSSSIKLVQFTEDRGVVYLENYGEIALGQFADKYNGAVANLDESQLQKAFQQLLINVPIKDPEAIAVAIPLSATLVVPIEIEVPEGLDPETLLLSELKDFVPVPLSDVLVDWQEVHLKAGDNLQTSMSSDIQTNLTENDAETADAQSPEELLQNPIVKKPSIVTKRNFLAFIVNKDIIQTYRRILSSEELEIEYFELEIYSVLRSALERGTPEAIVVDIGAKYTKFYGIKNSEVISAVKKLHGGIDFTNDISKLLNTTDDKAENLKRTLKLGDIPNEKLKKSLTQKVDKIIEGVERIRKENNFDVNTPVYLCGGGSLLYGLPQYVSESLNARIIICQPFVNSQAPDFLDKLLVETGPEYAVAAGLALKHLRTI